MAKFQYVEEGHTLLRTTKANAEKVKVVTGEIIEIEDGLYTDGRLMMSGFQKIIDGIEDVVEAAGNVVDEIKDAITGTDSTPEEAPAVPVVETTVEDDGKDAITVEVAAKPAKKEAPKKK